MSGASLTVIRHGKDGNLRDRAVTAFNATSTLVKGC